MHPTHRLTRADVAFYSGDSQLSYLYWQQADRGKARPRGHKGDQVGDGSVVVRTRDTVQGTRSGLLSDGAAVALVVEPTSYHSMLPEHAPLSSYRSKVKS